MKTAHIHNKPTSSFMLVSSQQSRLVGQSQQWKHQKNV